MASAMADARSERTGQGTKAATADRAASETEVPQASAPNTAANRATAPFTDGDVLLVKLRNQLSSFSKKERVIAEHLLEHGPAASTTAIGALAGTLGLSPGLIVGFCKKLGFQGFQELKQVLSTASPARRNLPIAGELPPELIVVNTFMNAAMAVEDTLMINDPKSFDEAAGWIAQAPRVEFFGSGGSARIAENAARKFLRFKPTVAFHRDSTLQLRSAQSLTPDCVGIGISYSGETEQVVTCLKTAKENGAKTIALTSTERSSLTLHADIVFLAAVRGVEMFNENEFSKIGQTVILDALYYCFINKLEGEKAAGSGLAAGD